MSEKLTQEQAAVIAAEGKIIVSASAGSGKTFVMIKKLCALLENGGDVDDVLAVTFTKKAAAQMKEKLRAALIERINEAEGQRRAHLKEQLSKISAADVSTIHSFCSHLLRTYFYALDFDSAFDIISDEDGVAAALKKSALDSLFDELYEAEDEDFKLLLACYRKKRSDRALREMVTEGYKAVKNTVGYREKLERAGELFTPQGFERVCGEYHAFVSARCREMRAEAQAFYSSLCVKNKEMYDALFEEIFYAIDAIDREEDIFVAPPKLCSNKKKDVEEDVAEGERYKVFRKKLGDKYGELYKELADRQTEEERFYQSGRVAVAFCKLLLRFDDEYTRIKREEGKLDYGDLEHYTLKLLRDEAVLKEIKNRYKYVYVDEYQDVNPVQEQILSAISGENSFLVGDVKQAIYGFRGSKSVFFAQKYARYEKGEGNALRLSNNFRSSDGVISFVNALFSRLITEETCGTDYRNKAQMLRGGGYPAGDGFAEVHVFGKAESRKAEAAGVYSVKESAEKRPAPTREGLAAVELVKRELGRQYYDLKEKKYKRIAPEDICILTRKKSNEHVTGIVRALTEAGFAVSGAQDGNVCNCPEVKRMLDILSYIDNSEQDIPLATALLSPIGGLNESELAQIRVAFQAAGKMPYRECCNRYKDAFPDRIAQKLQAFFARIEGYKNFADLFGASALIDKILEDTCWEAQYMRGGGRKLKNIRRLAAEAFSPAGELPLNAFLEKIKAGGYDIPAPDGGASGSIKIMTMHSSKGLEFPVVILADICRTFRGRDYAELPYDDKYGFVPKYYDVKNLLKAETMLTRLAKLRARQENFKNEVNLYYVACTRAMYGLHVLAEEAQEYDEYGVTSAKCYADMTDIRAFNPEYMQVGEAEFVAPPDQILISDPDEQLRAMIDDKFQRRYAFEKSVDLPVKSSASALLKLTLDDEYYAVNELFPEEDERDSRGGGLSYAGGTKGRTQEEGSALGKGKTSPEGGIAYHRFLQLCDFSRRDLPSVEEQLKEFVSGGKITQEQAALLDAQKLANILSMPVFGRVAGAMLYREREFLCRLPACEFLPTDAQDGVLVQGAIDLLAVRADGCAIIDYKYSSRSDESLIRTYARQLALYKKAVSLIMKVEEKDISTAIVNIYAGREILL